MIVMGIDQSFTSTGVVIVEDGVITFHTVISSDPNEDIFLRSQSITNEVYKIASKKKPNRVNIEGLGFSARGDQTRNLAGLQFSIVQALRFRGKFPVDLIAPTSLKKFATGSGKADKPQMYESLPEPAKTVLSAYKKTKGRPDVVDAYWLAVFPLPAS